MDTEYMDACERTSMLEQTTTPLLLPMKLQVYGSSAVHSPTEAEEKPGTVWGAHIATAELLVHSYAHLYVPAHYACHERIVDTKTRDAVSL